MDVEAYVLDVIRGRRRGLGLRPILFPISILYRSLISLRNKAYDWQWMASEPFPVPVVSIGNIVVGGTGKTPVTQMLTVALQEKLRPAILTRGFRSAMEKKGRRGCISTGHGPMLSAAECGDEPYLLAQKTKASIWVGSDRVMSAQAALAAGAECLLLDDGMQHRQIVRDYEVVVVDAQDPFSRHRFLPRGLLRDSPRRLRGARLIVVTHCRDVEQFEKTKRQLRAYTEAPMVGVKVDIKTPEALPHKIGLFCGLGNPEQFLQTVRDLNREITDTFLLKDHCAPSGEALSAFADKCRAQGAEALVCTEKDAVKLPSLSCGLPIIPLEMRLAFVAGQAAWDALVEEIATRGQT